MSGYDLIRPCEHCPFRSDIPGFLTRARVREIERALVQSEFYCHVTTNDDRFEDEEESNGSFYNPDGHEQHCAGALILLEKLNRPSQMMRIAERLGMYDSRRLDMSAPVYGTFREMIRRQSR